jgi:hypothetical protein
MSKMITKGIKKKFDELGLLDSVEEIEFYYTEHSKRYIKKLKSRPKKPPRLIGQNGLNYIQMALFRSKCLLQGSMHSLNNKNALISILSTRAHFEVTGGLALLLKNLEKYYDKKIDLDEITIFIEKITLGSKDKFTDQNQIPLNIPEPINVMKMIDAADTNHKRISGIREPIYRIMYDELSEFCHPNFCGISMGHEIENNRNVNYFDALEINKQNGPFVIHLSISAMTFLRLYDEILKLLEKNEELPIIIR